MLMPRLIVGIFSLVMMILSASTVCGQPYPNKLIRLVTGEPGNNVDFVSRLIAQGLTASLGQQVIVDNRPGAVIPAEIAAKASPDGYTLLALASPVWLTPLIQKTPYDPVRDFSPITLAVSSPSILVVHPSLPAKSVRELIALAKARPGVLNYAASTIGGSPYLATELFKSMAGVNIVGIFHKSTGPAVIDLIAGEVQVMISNAAAVVPPVKAGRLRALAVTSAGPSTLFPGLPTIAASGVPGYEYGTLTGVFAPAKTPTAIIDRVNQEIVRFLNRAEVKEKFFDGGVEVVASSPEQFAAAIKADMTRMGKVIKNAGIRGE